MRALPPTLLLLAACSSTPEPELLAPDAIGLSWSEAYNGQEDGLGAMVPIDFMVYDGASGEPLGGVVLQVTTEHDGTWLLPGSGSFGVDDRPSVGHTGPERLWWDARHDRFVDLGAMGSAVRVGSVTLVTGPDGVARTQVFVDQFPVAAQHPVFGGGPGRSFQDVALLVSSASPDDAVGGAIEGTVLLQPR